MIYSDDQILRDERRCHDIGPPFNLAHNAHFLLHADIYQRSVFDRWCGVRQGNAGAIECCILGIEKNQDCFLGYIIQNVRIIEHIPVELFGQFEDFIGNFL